MGGGYEYIILIFVLESFQYWTPWSIDILNFVVRLFTDIWEKLRQSTHSDYQLKLG